MSGAGKTILVTGGGGYIASHCIIELLKEDFEVVAVDNFINSIRGEISNFKKAVQMPKLYKRLPRPGGESGI